MEIFNKKSLAKDEIIQFEISDDITKKVANFYSKNPFPSYNNDENKYSLLNTDEYTCFKVIGVQAGGCLLNIKNTLI